MKQFLLFGGERYYPRGGWSDLQGKFDDFDLAKTAAELAFNPKDGRWWQIVDLETMDVAAESK